MSGTSSRGNPSMGDIARSIAVLGAILLVLFAVGRLLTVTPDEPTRAVDYRSAVESSRTVADFELLAPDSLPQGWRATSVRFEPDSWHLGVLTDDDDYVGLEQVKADTPAGDRAVRERKPRRTARPSSAARRGRCAPARATTSPTCAATGDMTIVVTGTAPRDVMERYISSLSSS